MTETEWLLGSNPDDLLGFFSHKASERKRRLFTIACCRRIWNRMDEPSRIAVEVSERYADHHATHVDLSSQQDYLEILEGIDGWASEAAFLALRRPAPIAEVSAAALLSIEEPQLKNEERRNQVALLRDILGNPFRPLPFDRAWLHWNDQCVVRLARSIYDSHTFGDLPILADALAEAGCTQESILEHCRAPGLHARGCWVVDGILGYD